MQPCYRKDEEEKEKSLACGCSQRSHGIHQGEPAGWFLGATAGEQEIWSDEAPRYRGNILQALHAYRISCEKKETAQKKN